MCVVGWGARSTSCYWDAGWFIGRCGLCAVIQWWWAENSCDYQESEPNSWQVPPPTWNPKQTASECLQVITPSWAHPIDCTSCLWILPKHRCCGYSLCITAFFILPFVVQLWLRAVGSACSGWQSFNITLGSMVRIGQRIWQDVLHRLPSLLRSTASFKMVSHLAIGIMDHEDRRT